MVSRGRVTFQYAYNRRAANRIASYLRRHGWKNVRVRKFQHQGRTVYGVSGQIFRKNTIRKTKR